MGKTVKYSSNMDSIRRIEVIQLLKKPSEGWKDLTLFAVIEPGQGKLFLSHSLRHSDG